MKTKSTRYFLLLLLFHAAIAHQSNADPAIKAVQTIGFTVRDMERSVKFYSTVLTFRKVSDVEVFGKPYEQLTGIFGCRIRVVQMQLGNEKIELSQYLTPTGNPVPIDSKSNDLWFQHIAIVVSDMQKAYHTLRQFNVQHVSTAPQRIPDWNKTAAGIKAFYFRDPDQHNLEIIYFPPGKGDAKWQNQSNRLFLGIDHTAISVANTQTSLKFYRDFLGMKIAGTSENYGTEQEHLNQVFGAHLRITALRAPGGPGIELLEYLTPRDGRPYPIDARPNDLLYWQTTLVGKNVDALFQRAKKHDSKIISAGVIALPAKTLGFSKGFILRDPDGHALQFIQQ